MWYGGPRWQIEALWQFQIPSSSRSSGTTRRLTEMAKRNILGLNSARLYRLYGANQLPVGAPGSA